MIDREKVARVIGEVYDGYADPVETPNNWARATGAADAAIASVLEQLREPLEAIAKDCWVPGRSDKEMYRAWRAIAVERVDIARGLLAAAFLQPPDSSNPAE